MRSPHRSRGNVLYSLRLIDLRPIDRPLQPNYCIKGTRKRKMTKEHLTFLLDESYISHQAPGSICKGCCIQIFFGCYAFYSDGNSWKQDAKDWLSSHWTLLYLQDMAGNCWTNFGPHLTLLPNRYLCLSGCSIAGRNASYSRGVRHFLQILSGYSLVQDQPVPYPPTAQKLNKNMCAIYMYLASVKFVQFCVTFFCNVCSVVWHLVQYKVHYSNVEVCRIVQCGSVYSCAASTGYPQK